ncbi:hypothetical protein BURMUCGD2M_5837 [Burkholderia multivorans CGD2M]|uniref:Uncharacterized protein n=1 Tax=Burkholderia multivorans CGD2 TaxID=513052 RepID=B9BL89_9BURK|nr:hypothetical protein BURMUCGD2_5847 [Burkholderia multivorans CGD2]EEE16392.1 hypothetical protein BURMUCGD2M_5837 [Burkholderia multivorans CGD2M]
MRRNKQQECTQPQLVELKRGLKGRHAFFYEMGSEFESAMEIGMIR